MENKTDGSKRKKCQDWVQRTAIGINSEISNDITKIFNNSDRFIAIKNSQCLAD